MRGCVFSARPRWPRFTWLFALVLSLAVAMVGLTGCAGQQNNAVVMQGLQFKPSTITVKAGTTVTWTNKDQTAHSTTSDDWKEGTTNPNAWNSGPLNPGQSFTFTFKTPGTYKYSCMVHTYMHGTVIVQ